MLGSSAEVCALALGVTLQKSLPVGAVLARFDGVSGATSCCHSVTLTLSAFSVNCTCGAAKLFNVSAPLALVCPTDAATFPRIADFWLKRMSELRIWIGLLSEGTFNVAFWTFPVPLRFNAQGFLVGPWARTSRINTPAPDIASTAEIPYGLALLSTSSIRALAPLNES